MNLVVLAYQEVGTVCLEALFAAGARVSAVVTHEDDPQEEIWFRSVAELARSRGIPVFTPDNPNDPEFVSRIRSLAPDLIFSFYYRYMLSEEFLSLAPRGAFNLHGSLLPQYRGRAPINWVLVRGEKETGVTLHQMTVRPDAGPIAAQKKVPIDEADTVREVYTKITRAASELVTEVWPRFEAGTVVLTPQDDSRATYFGGRGPKDGWIDWNRTAKQLHDLCRAVTHPYPGAFARLGGRKLLIWAAEPDLAWQGPEPPGQVLGLVENGRGLAVASARGRLIVRAAQWAGEAEHSGADLASLGLGPGAQFDLFEGETS